ncbi:AraC family transcriptional regulator [Paenibacillus sp. MBLB4367]|uniref:AraC family transcriptional regulator n=1 Tax=Paenibacillus sp. MBLB4367 TaxID=3384767 RepID=UPI0039082391
MTEAKRLFRRRSIFVTTFLSLLLLLLFPVLAQSVLYKKMEAVIGDNVDRSNRAMLNQMSQAVDSRLNDVEQLARTVSFHPKLQWLLSGHAAEHPLPAYDYLEFTRVLKQFGKGNGTSYPFFVYLDGSGLVLTPEVKVDSPTFASQYFRYEGVSFEEWRKLLLQGGERYLPSMDVPQQSAGKAEPYLTFIRSLPYGETENVQGAVVIPIQTSLISGLIDGLDWSNRGDIYIFDKQKRLLMTTAAGQAAGTDFASLFTERTAGGRIGFKADDRSMMVSSSESGRSGWTYVSVVPKAVYLDKVHTVQKWALTLLAVVLIIGLSGAYALARRQYGPVREIVRAITRNDGEENGGWQGIREEGNEYRFIEKALKRTWDAEKRSNDIVAAQTPDVRAHFLNRLVKGFVESSAVTPQALDFMGVAFGSDRFAVVIADADDRLTFGEEAAGDSSERHAAMVRFVIANIGQECLGARHTAYAIELDKSRLAFLINAAPERMAEAAADMETAVREMKGWIESRFRLPLSIGISDIHEGAGRIGVCYGEAVQAAEYNMMKGKSSITLYREMSHATDHFYYPIDMELQLINLIKAADGDKAAALIDRIFHLNFESRTIPLELGKCLFFNMMGTLVKVLNEVSDRYDAVFGEKFDPVKRLADCRTTHEMRDEMHHISAAICRYIRESRSDSGKRLAEEITGYIEAHYPDPMLSLQSIADRFQLTPHYLSAFYKKHSGVNLADMMARTRVREAKRLLESESLTINQIAAQVGYANDAGLIRLFKKYEGVTPGKYRESQAVRQQAEQAEPSYKP